MRWHLCLALLFAIFTPPGGMVAGPIVVPPGLHAGDQYRLAFVTSTSTMATSTNIEDYNVFVTDAANSDPTLASLGTTWTAIGSTSTESATTNTNTDPSSTGFPIYNLAGQLLATSNTDFWDGTLANPILYDEHGDTVQPGYSEVWTGTGTTGIPTGPDDPFGSVTPAWGDASSASTNWIYAGQGQYVSVSDHTMYGISGVLTVVPEPSALVLAAIGGLALLTWRRRALRK